MSNPTGPTANTSAYQKSPQDAPVGAEQGIQMEPGFGTLPLTPFGPVLLLQPLRLICRCEGECVHTSS